MGAYADEFKAKLPLPAADSRDDVGYAAAAEQGGTSAALLEFVMQRNLRCDWYDALLNNRGGPAAAEVLRGIPQWPAFRAERLSDPQSRARTKQIGEDVARGNRDSLRGEVVGPACNPAAARRATP